MINLEKKTCIVCHGPMTGDSGNGGFEFHIHCAADPHHFNYAANIFGTYIKVLGQKFDSLAAAIQSLAESSNPPEELSLDFEVFEINECIIAADHTDQALAYYMQKIDPLQNYKVGRLVEGEAHTITISLKRLTAQELAEKRFFYPIHNAENGQEGYNVFSIIELIQRHNEACVPFIVHTSRTK